MKAIDSIYVGALILIALRLIFWTAVSFVVVHFIFKFW